MVFGWTFLMNLTINAYSREGKSFWLLKAAPLSVGRLVAGKYLISFLVSLVFQWILFGFVIALHWPGISTVIYTFLMSIFFVAGLTGITLTFGAYGAKLDWEDPRRMSSGPIGCLSLVAGLVYIVLVWLMFFAPPALIPVLGGPLWMGQLIGLVVGGTFSLVCAIVPPRQSLARVGKIGLV
jgi:ABC-type Na+ efflux pump permease subunit